MRGYKGFKKGLICKDKQYSENTVFEEPEAEICKSGMHFCKEPLDVLTYYPLIDNNGNMTEFAEVEGLGEYITNDSRKYCTKKMKIGSKISFSELVNSFISNYTNIKCSDGKNVAEIKNCSNYAKIGVNQNSSIIYNSGLEPIIGVNGDFINITNNGYKPIIASFGEENHIYNDGFGAEINSYGHFVNIINNGRFSHISSIGDMVCINNNGYDSIVDSDGNNAIIFNRGNNVSINSYGENARIFSISCKNYPCRVRAKKGSWITLTEYNTKDGKITEMFSRTEFVDGIRIKEDFYYTLYNGRFFEEKLS